MPAYELTVNAARQWTNPISAGSRAAAVPASGSPRDYGVDLAGYCGDDVTEPVIFQVQRSRDS